MPTELEVTKWIEEVDLAAAKIGPRFSRKDLRAHSVRYLRGLISRIERKNGWQLAEELGEQTPTNLQHFIARSSWDADQVRDDLQRYVAEHPEVIEQLLRLLLRANRFITQNPEQSANQIAEWLGIDPEIERLSLPTIKYTTDFDEDWHRGVNFWVDSMIESDKLKKNVKTAHEQGKLNKKIYNMQTFKRAQKNN